MRGRRLEPDSEEADTPAHTRRALLGVAGAGTAAAVLAGCAPRAVLPSEAPLGIYPVASFGLDAEDRDLTGATRRAMQSAAEASGGTVLLPAGEWELSARLRVPAGIHLVGAGSHGVSSGSRGTTVRLTTRQAGLSIADGVDPYERGFVVADFELDGGGVAETPLLVGRAEACVIGPLHVRGSAGDGVVVDACRDSVFTSLTLTDHAAAGLRVHGPAHNNLFTAGRVRACGAASVVIGEEGADVAQAPTRNSFVQWLVEGGPSEAPVILHDAGVDNSFVSSYVVATSPSTASFVRVRRATGLRFSDCHFDGSPAQQAGAVVASIDDADARVYWTGVTRTTGIDNFSSSANPAAVTIVGLVETSEGTSILSGGSD